MKTRVQLVLGFGGLAWAIFLLPRTSFVMWIAANLLYGILAFAAAELWRRHNRRQAQMVASFALLIFVAANATVASLACRSNGACSQILLVTFTITISQIVIIVIGA